MKISSCINTIEAFLKSVKPSSNAFFIGDDCKKIAKRCSGKISRYL